MGHEVKTHNLFEEPGRSINTTPDSIFDRILAQPHSYQELLQDVKLAINKSNLLILLAIPVCILLASC
jgi:hypothetical protein